jgi:hypothetical protein
MVKLSVRLSAKILSMKTSNSQVLPAPPSFFKTLAAGFDTITNHISLILFPIGLDLLIWFAPRLRVAELINGIVRDLILESQKVAPEMETSEMLNAAQELWTLAGEQFNLMAALRSYPVGIPSIMTSMLPSDHPLGSPAMLEIDSFMGVVGFYLSLSLIGLILGTLYFKFVAQAAVSNEVRWGKALMDWPWLSTQTILLALVWLGLLFAISIPASCAISLAALGSAAIGQCGILIYVGLLVWIIFPLLFSAHGIFVNRNRVWPSIKQGILITRLTLPATSLFFIGILLISQGLDMLWRIPPENSWLMLIGLAGHAFVSTGLLATSFIYYRDADRWILSLRNTDPRADELEAA